DGVLLIIKSQLPTTALNSSERRVRIDFVHASVEKAAPVVGESCIESGDHVIESVGHHFWTRVWGPIKSPAEIIERFLPVRLLTNQRVRIEPDQPALVIEIDAASPGRPVAGGIIKQLRGDGCVFETAPGTARPIEIGGDGGSRPTANFRTSRHR